jgi:uncharacterized protein
MAPMSERIFLDTSAAYALLVASDTNHRAASRAFHEFSRRRAPLSTTSYVLVETYALLGRRVGLTAVKTFRMDLRPLLDVVWVDEGLHERGLDLLLDRGLPDLSLVDAVSFLAMRDHEIGDAFAFDRHFQSEGFNLIA